MTLIIGAVTLLSEHDSDFSHSILEPLKITGGYDEYDFLTKTMLIPRSAAPVYLRSFHFNGGADFLQFRLPKKDIKKYIKQRKKNPDYKISKLPLNRLCKVSFDKAKYSFRVPEFFLPNLRSSKIRYGYIKRNNNGSYDWCRRLDIYDYENEYIWYIKRSLKN
jgi:hypothetical protein